MVWLILLAVVFILIIFALVTPLEMTIDTERDMYCIRLKGILWVSVVPDQAEGIFLRMKMGFFTWNIYPLRRSGKGTERRPAKASGKHRVGKRISRLPQRMLNVLRSFHITDLKWYMDTGDDIRNAYLFPVLWFLSGKRRVLSVNFYDRNSLKLIVQNRLIRMIYAFIQ